MLNISTASKNLYKQNRLPNTAHPAEIHLYVEVIDTHTVITDDQIESENFTLEESICSEEELYFGNCESSRVQFAVYNVSENLIGKKIHIWQTIGSNHEVVSLGYFKVAEETKRDGNTGLWKDIVAYDYLADLLDMDVLEWWLSLWENNDWLSVGNIWKSLLTHLGITYTQMSLANDTARVTSNVSPTNLTARKILQACGELSGVFGQMGRDGKFKWVSIYDARHISMIYPSETLYPATSLYPIQISGGSYGSEDNLDGTNPLYFMDESHYEDYAVLPIDSVIVQDYDGALAVKVGATDDNSYIVFGNFLTWGMSSEQQTEVANTLFSIIYNLSYTPNVTTMIGLPYLECGDVINIVLANKTITTPLFQRTLTGIMSLTDQVTSKGPEKRTNKADSTRMTFALDAEDAVTRMLLTKTEDSILTQVSTIYQTKEQVESIVEVSREGILLEVSAEYPNGETVQNMIQLAVDGITLAGKTIDMTANNIKINSDNFKVDEYGNVWAQNGTFSGKITADSGSIGIFSIDDAGIKWLGRLPDNKYMLSQYYGTRLRFWHNTTSAGDFQSGTKEVLGMQVGSNVFGNYNAWVSGYGYYSTGDIVISSASGQGFYIGGGTRTNHQVRIDGDGISIKNSSYQQTATISDDGEILLPYIGETSGGATIPRRVRFWGGRRIELDYGLDQNDGPTDQMPMLAITAWNNTNGNMDTQVTSNGYIFQAPYIVQTSDRRLKDDIEDIGDIQKIYKALRPRSYVYKSDHGSEKKRFGLIAQEVLEALEVGGYSEDDTRLVELQKRTDGTEYYSLCYDMLHAFHIQMIQKQQKLIEDLTARIEALESQLSDGKES